MPAITRHSVTSL